MSKHIVGRLLEKENLHEALNTKRAELIAIYGRRRIGKTYLIREYYANKLRNKEVQFKTSTKTKKGINTIMLTTWGVEGKHAKGLVMNSLTLDCLFT